jgi:hypothetical protein
VLAKAPMIVTDEHSRHKCSARSKSEASRGGISPS